MSSPLPLLLSLFLAGSAMAENPSKDELKTALTKDSDDREALYNLGLTHYLEGEYAEAIRCWKRLRRLEPEDWQLRAKLIQAHWAAGEPKEAEKALKELKTERAAGKHPELNEQTFFIRDQFTVDQTRVFTLEYFDLKGEKPLLWKFVLQSEGETQDAFLSVGSYEMTTEIMRAQGAIDSKIRAYHLDRYGNDGSHETFGFYRGAPDYGKVRKEVEDILRGVRKPESSSRVKPVKKRDAGKAPEKSSKAE